MIVQDKDLTLSTTLRLKSVAKQYTEARSREDLVSAKKYAIEHKLDLFVIGGGSNTVITKPQMDGLVVKNFYMKSEIIKDEQDYVELSVSSGYPVTKLVNETVEKGYEGFEYQLGLPGTVGGAVYMNSKWTKPVSYFGDSLVYAYLLDSEGTIKKVDREYFQFAYDYSKLQDTKEILLEAVFHLKKTSPDVLTKRAKEASEYRKQTQPFGVASSGCVFQNVDGQSAGALIDKAGLKGTKIGAFSVSKIHANFIINDGGGSPGDFKKLVSLIKKTVKQNSGIELKEEVRVIS